MIALLLAAALSILYPYATARSDMEPPPDCARLLGQSCQNWKLATWLPNLPENAPASRVAFVDRMQGAPGSGTPFTYGKAGPPRGFALYDTTHRIAFYGEGCCSWHSAVLAAGVEPPPLRVENRLLEAIHTARGLYLGMSIDQVRLRYGHARAAFLKDVPGVSNA
jgi:hypothetical protein